MANKAAIRIDLSGAQDLIESLRQFRTNRIKSILSASMRAAGKPVVRIAKATVARDSGLLRKAIGATVRTFNGGAVGWLLIHARPSVSGMVDRAGRSWNIKARTGVQHQFARPSKYAHLVEYGTRQHALSRGRGKGQHPGTKPQPFFRPAAEQGQALALAEFTRVMRERIEKELLK